MSNSEVQLFKYHSDTVEVARKDCGLDGPGRMEEAINMIEEWLKMQNHLLKKDIPRAYIETTLVTSKGSVERSKQRLDRLCTLRTMKPEFFPNDITKEKFTILHDYCFQALSPKLTKDHLRVFSFKLICEDFDSNSLQTFYQYIVVICEYCKMHDYNLGYLMILDFRDINILHFLTKMSPMDLKHFFTLLTEGYGMKIKRIDVISDSKLVDSLVSLFKQSVSAKLGGRIQVHKDLNTLHEVVEKHLLPEDYGGEEKPLVKLFDQWLDVYCSKKNVEIYREMNRAKTDETCRAKDVFNEQYVGMPGCFRTLSVD